MSKCIVAPFLEKRQNTILTLTAGYRPCKVGELTAEGNFGMPLNLSLIAAR